jgi:hypothetical protein
LRAKKRNGKKNAFIAIRQQLSRMDLNASNRVIYAKNVVVSFTTKKYCVNSLLLTIIFLASKQN